VLQVLTNLGNSEKAVVTLALIIASTVLVALGHLSAQEWTSYTATLAGIYVGGKTVQGATSVIADAVKHKQDSVSGIVAEGSTKITRKKS
jgi:hypothetical protein